MAERISTKMSALFEQANSQPALKQQLLHNPAEVAKQFGVEFSAEEIMQLQKLGGLADLADEIKTGRLFPRPPIFYPIQVWQIEALADIFTQALPGAAFKFPGPIFYPAEFGFQAGGFKTMAAFNPGWVSYPGEGTGGGGGSVGGGWHIPGPIFYPISLRNFIMARLVQILQVKQG